jgi:AcrR family transcriptional regulator
LEKREIQIIRMMSYFIDATAQIIEEEGIDNVTIRKIADIAGYNSATIYNYFGELSHLIFFATMRFLKKYADALPEYMGRGKDPLERYLLLWECFCKFSFKEPQIYHAIFTSNLGGQPEELINDYYGIYPTDLINLPEDLKPMFLESNLSKRGRIALEKCIEAGYIKDENAEEIVEILTLVWQGMHIMMLNNRRNHTAEEATEITMKYIRQIVMNGNQFKL